MKIVIFAVAVGFLALDAAAEFPRGMIGAWTGTRTEIFNGVSVTGKQTTRFRRSANGGASGKTTIVFPGIGTLVATGDYGGLGNYSAEGFFRGQVVSISTGNWRSSRNTVHVTGKTQSTSGTYSANATMRLVGRKRLVVISTLSNGGRISITLRKK